MISTTPIILIVIRRGQPSVRLLPVVLFFAPSDQERSWYAGGHNFLMGILHQRQWWYSLEIFFCRWPAPLPCTYYRNLMPDMAITQCRDCNKVTFAFRNATHRHATQVHQSFFTAPDKWQLFSGISHWWLWTPASTERTLPVLQARNTWISFSFTALHYSLFIKLISNLFQVSWTSISTRGAGVDWDNPSENWDYGLEKPGYRANAMTNL